MMTTILIPPRSMQPITDGYAPNRRRRRVLVTTKMLEKAIAAPAIIGLRSPIAASGSAATL